MTATEQFDAAQLTQWQWKTKAMMDMAAAVVGMALDPFLDEFAADDLPPDMDHGGPGIAGSIFARLEQNGIVERVGIREGETFYGKERASSREGRKAAKLKVYRLRDAGKARAFLKAQHRYLELQQAELIAV